LEEVVDPLEWPVGCSSAGVVGEDLVSPGDDLVHDVVVFGDFAAVVEVGEPFEGLVGGFDVVGFVDLVELLEGVPGDFQSGMGAG